MIRPLFALLCLFAFVLPAAAQSATCEIDLASTVTLLVQAQAAASSGDTEAALAQIAQAREKLEGYEAVCGEGEDVTPALSALELTQTRTIEDFEFDATFNYPDGWSIMEESGGMLFASASEILNRDFDSAPPPFAPGEAAIFMQVGNASSFGNDDTDSPSELLAELAAQVPSSFGPHTEIASFSVNDRPAALFTVSGASTDLMLMAASLGTFDGEPLFAQFILLTAPGELNSYEPTLKAVAESIAITTAS